MVGIVAPRKIMMKALFASLATSLFLGSPVAALAADGPVLHLTGHYPDEQLGAIKSISLPRTFLYDANDRLVAKEQWPAELDEVRRNMGDSFCCVSDDATPSVQGGPPANCVKIIYGQEIKTNFDGLTDAVGLPIRLEQLPPHQWLLVEYAADWCAPCQVERKALERFFSKSPQAARYAWVTVDMTRLPDVQTSARKAK